MKPLLSICITVYNQSKLLKWNLENILKYQNDDIEVLISDNCSTEDIKGIVYSYNDSRVKYTKTQMNYGQDGNIFHALEEASSDYVYLFRTRDTILVEEINYVLEKIKLFPEVAYMRFSGRGENGEKKLPLKDKVYVSGKQLVCGHERMGIHPSGEIYNKKYLDKDLLNSFRQFIVDRFPKNNAYLAHILLRIYLSNKSYFVSDSRETWLYCDTLRAEDVAVNAEKDGISPYSPRFQYPRMKCELEFVDGFINNRTQSLFIRSIIRKYYRSVVYYFSEINDSKLYQSHYKCGREEYSSQKEKIKFINYSRNEFSALKPNIRREIKLTTFFESTGIPYRCEKFKGVLRNIKRWVVK